MEMGVPAPRLTHSLEVCLDHGEMLSACCCPSQSSAGFCRSSVQPTSVQTRALTLGILHSRAGPGLSAKWPPGGESQPPGRARFQLSGTLNTVVQLCPVSASLESCSLLLSLPGSPRPFAPRGYAEPPATTRPLNRGLSPVLAADVLVSAPPCDASHIPINACLYIPAL